MYCKHLKEMYCFVDRSNGTRRTKAVIKTLEKAKDDEEMDFAEAFNYAVDKRKFIVYRSANEAEQVQREEEGEAGGQ